MVQVEKWDTHGAVKPRGGKVEKDKMSVVKLNLPSQSKHCLMFSQPELHVKTRIHSKLVTMKGGRSVQ